MIKRKDFCLHRVIHYNNHIKETLFVDPKEIGSHSIRKDAATYYCAGVYHGPPIVSVCLRAGWTMGRVEDRHPKYENAGDEFVGRKLTGKPPASCEFRISLVYFLYSQTDESIVGEFVYLIFPIDKPESYLVSYINLS